MKTLILSPFLACALFACKPGPSAPAPKLASEKFDSVQVEILREKQLSDSIEKGLLKPVD